MLYMYSTGIADVHQKLMYSLMYRYTAIHSDTSNVMYHPGSACWYTSSPTVMYVVPRMKRTSV